MKKGNLSQMVLVDSDAFIAWLVEEDLLHESAVGVMQAIRDAELTTITTSLVVAETATTLSNRLGQPQARAFLEFVTQLPIIHITEDLQKETLGLFRQ